MQCYGESGLSDMSHPEYIKFTDAEPAELLPILNKQTTREHLIDHEQFDLDGVKAWMQGKAEEDDQPGCRVRAVVLDQKLIGWCGIQCEEEQYEIAIVIDESS